MAYIRRLYDVEDAAEELDAASRRALRRERALPVLAELHAWLLQQKGLISIPKAGTQEHVRENYGALKVRLTANDLAELDSAFSPPGKKKPLGMI